MFCKNIKKFFKQFLCFILISICVIPCFAWDGYDYDKGTYIEIEQGNIVRLGNEIEVYDYSTGDYKTYEVNDINRKEIEVYDWDTGEYRTFEMD